MALDLGGRHAEAERAYEWLRRHAEPGRLVARVLRRQRRQGPDARHQRRLLRRHRRLAPLPLHRRHRVPARALADGRAHHRLRARLPDRDRRDRVACRRPGRRRAAHRLVEHPPSACAARSRSPSGSVTTVPTGSCRSARSPSRSRTGPSASSTRTAGRWTGTTRSSAACSAARPRRCASPHFWDTFVVAGPRRALRVGPAVGDRGRDLRARDGARRDRRDRARPRPLPLGAVPAPRRRRVLVRHELRRRALRPDRRALHRRPAHVELGRRRARRPRARWRRARPRVSSAARRLPVGLSADELLQAGVEIEHDRNRR